MKRIKRQACVLREQRVSQYVPITHLNSASCFETYHGKVGAVIKLQGVNYLTASYAQLDQHRLHWHQALLALGSCFSVYVTVHRVKQSVHLSGDFQQTFTQQLDQRYQRNFHHTALYQNHIYLTVLYQGETLPKRSWIQLWHRVSPQQVRQQRQHWREQHMQTLQQAIRQLMSLLSAYQPRLLGEQDATLGYSELLSFWARLISAGQQVKWQQPAWVPPLVKRPSAVWSELDKYPWGNVAHYLATQQLLFGRAIQFQSPATSQQQFAAILSIKHYPPATASVMLDSLLGVDAEYMATNSFTAINKEVALERVKKHAIKMRNVRDPAISQHDQLNVLRDQIASGETTLGLHHNTLLLIATSLEELESKIDTASKCYAEVGYVMVRETIGQQPAFWSQLPGNHKYIARASLVTSNNFVDFAALHNESQGFKDGNHLGSAVTVVETSARTPYFFNYHSRSATNNPARGHAIIVGGNNAGKTAFMCFMDAQMSRYGGKTFYFDRDQGAKPYVLACDGQYYQLFPGANELAFNPLQLADTPLNRQLCHALLQCFCEQGNGSQLTAEATLQLREAIDYAYEHLAPATRNYNQACLLLPLDFPYRPALHRWLQHSEGTPGDYAYLFANASDDLTINTNKTGFDLTHFLDREPTWVRTTLMMYLFHRIEQVMDGQLTSILLDEGWQYLDDPYWQVKLSRWLPSIRKRNGHMILATQSPASIVRSPICSCIMDNVATQIYFANPQADKADYIDGLKLTDNEFQFVASNTPQSRLFLLKQDNSSIVCRLNLSHCPELLTVLSGNTRSIQRLEQLRRYHGCAAVNWLSIFMEDSTSRC